MSIYMTEDEQIVLIKKWWRKYNGIITVLLSVVLLIIAGFKYWHWHQEKVNEQASSAYEHLMVAFSTQDIKSIRSYANQLIAEYNDTVYADAARLTLAKLYVSKEHYGKARQELAYVALHSKMQALSEVARIRLARLFIAEQSYDKALQELSLVNDKAYLPLVNELRGDIYSLRKDYHKAVVFYRKAIEGVQKNGIGNLFLEMKTNEMTALTQSMNGHTRVHTVSM